MGEERITDATDMLLSRGDGGAATDPRLDPLIYEEVRRLAGRIMRGERAHHTLQPTALANEAYMRLIDASRVQARDRNRFLALTAKAMRNILVDHARKRDAAKRGLDPARHHGHPLAGLTTPLRVNSRGAVGPQSDPAVGRVGV